MWMRIEEGDTDGDVQDWVRAVAKRILEADADVKKLGSSQRVYEITRAVGLAGKIDKKAPLRALVNALEGFTFLEEKDGEVVKRAAHRGEDMRVLIDWVRQMNLASDNLTDEEVRKRIDRATKTISKPAPKPAR